MQSNFIGHFEKIDEYGRLVINHEDDKFEYLPFWKWHTKLIGRTNPRFIGLRFNKPSLPLEFKQGDKVKVHITLKKYHMRADNVDGYKLTFDKMELII